LKAKEKLEELNVKCLKIYRDKQEEEREVQKQKRDKEYYSAVVKSFEERLRELEMQQQKLMEKLLAETR
jgi:hypothetical protein